MGMDRKTVLIVDNENGIRDLLGMSLAGAGYNPVLCEDGKHAILYISNADLIITDFSMPGGMNGAELTKIAKREKPGMPVIIMTGTPLEIPSDHLADQVIEKPFKFEQLREAVANLLQKGGCHG